METAITVILIVGVLIAGILGLVQTAISTQSTVSQSTYVMQTRLEDHTRTSIASVSATADPVLGNWVDVTLRNTGTSKLANYEQWDVILQYTDAFGATRIQWYPYLTGWSKQIYQTAPTVPEVFDPGIFNPGEEMTIRVNVAVAIQNGSTNLATIATPNGITASSIFTR
jgi:hypothetical protein